ncbi:hypothetical protein [Ornithinibacillus californiensis]|uniref:hypothetical protein n=1 Tax=Ornithinibacillus californiensis TaxID=161536 RepID=UPI00064DCB2C|nr:hypothetical protein [Ornithinibacillus californiensis]
MVGLLNIGSLLLGLMAWILPIISLTQSKNRKWVTFPILSISACAISLFFQLFYNYHLVKIEDWSALMDTTGAVVFAAVVLLTGTVVLNVATLIVYYRTK